MARDQGRTTLPQNQAALRAWLRDTDEGRKILREATEEFLECEIRNWRHPKVLVVGRLDAGQPFVEVYWEKGVAVKTVEMVDTDGTAASDLMVEGLLQRELPKLWRCLIDKEDANYVGGHWSTCMALKGQAVDQALDLRLKAYILKEIRKA